MDEALRRLIVIKLQIGTMTFTCDTVEEAVILGKLSGKPVEAPQTLHELATYAGQELDTEDMIRLTGVKSVNGLGPRLAALRRHKKLQVVKKSPGKWAVLQ